MGHRLPKCGSVKKELASYKSNVIIFDMKRTFERPVKLTVCTGPGVCQGVDRANNFWLGFYYFFNS